MLLRFFLVLNISALFSIICFAEPTSNNPASQVYLIKSLQYNPIVDTYEEVSLGSAVYVSQSQIVTNAHVVLDTTHRPYGAYLVCTADSIKEPPKCAYTAKLIKYDRDNDLALLDVSTISSQKKVILSDIRMPWKLGDTLIGETIRVYGYPSNGGDTITMTEGKLSGYLEDEYKIDANLDGGNSGGGAFNNKNEFIGIPYAVRAGYTTLGYVIPAKKVERFINNPAQGIWHDKWDITFLKSLKRDLEAQGTTKISTPYFDWVKFSGFRVASFNSNLSGDRFIYTLKSISKKTFITVQKNKIFSTSGIFSKNDLTDMLDAFRYDTLADAHLKTHIDRDVNIGKMNFPVVYKSIYTKNDEDSFYNKYYINGSLSVALFGDSLKKSRGDIKAFFSTIASYFTFPDTPVEKTSIVDMGYFFYNIRSTGYVILGPPLYASANSLFATIRDGNAIISISSWYYPNFDVANDKGYTFEKYVLKELSGIEITESGKNMHGIPYVLVHDPEEDTLYLYTIVYKGSSAQILSVVVSERDKLNAKAILKYIANGLSGTSGIEIH